MLINENQQQARFGHDWLESAANAYRMAHGPTVDEALLADIYQEFYQALVAQARTTKLSLVSRQAEQILRQAGQARCTREGSGNVRSHVDALFKGFETIRSRYADFLFPLLGQQDPVAPVQAAPEPAAPVASKISRPAPEPAALSTFQSVAAKKPVAVLPKSFSSVWMDQARDEYKALTGNVADNSEMYERLGLIYSALKDESRKSAYVERAFDLMSDAALKIVRNTREDENDKTGEALFKAFLKVRPDFSAHFPPGHPPLPAGYRAPETLVHS
jgi:hypothetical protein